MRWRYLAEHWQVRVPNYGELRIANIAIVHCCGQIRYASMRNLQRQIKLRAIFRKGCV